MPDFSNVGYHGGDAAIPLLAVKAEVSPRAGEADSGARIQAAIDQVGRLPKDEHGWRGAVLIHRGRYRIRGTLRMDADGVVLRGEGYGKEGTWLVAAGATQRSLITIAAGAVHGARGEDEGASSDGDAGAGGGAAAITDAYVPVGARSFHVAEPGKFRVGEEVVVRRPSTAVWIHKLGMDRIPQSAEGNTVQWKAGSKDLLFSRVITGIEGDELRVDAPVMCALDKEYGGGTVGAAPRSAALSEVGVENLAGDSDYRSPTDEKHGWVLVDVAAARNAWVRNVVAMHFGYSCVYVHKGSKWITVDHCACMDAVSQIIGGRRYSFALDGELTLVQHCYSRNGRHDFVMHALAAGPNVFSDCVAVQSHADSGPHHRWSVGTLYDNLKLSAAGSEGKSGGQLNIRNRGNSGTGHGWAGADQVVWNCRAERMIIENPPTAQNWAIGCTAGAQSGDGDWESRGHAVEPKSLYEAQLAERHAGVQ